MSTLAVPRTATTTWKIDPVHSVAEFKVKHMMISNVKGQFTGITGVLSLDETDLLKSHVEASIDAASINTRDPQRDAHLKSADFFDAEKFPTLSFKSTHLSRAGDSEFVSPLAFNPGGLEGQRWILGDVKEIGALEVIVTLPVAGIYRCGIDCRLNAGFGHIGFIERQNARHASELAFDV